MIGTLVSCALAWHGSDPSQLAIAASTRGNATTWTSSSTESGPKVVASKAESMGVMDPTAYVATATVMGPMDPTTMGTSSLATALEPGDIPLDTGSGRPSGAVPAPELAPLPRSRWIDHRRVPQESLTQIAHRYRVTEAKLREWNELGPDDPPPKRGKRLRVRAQRLPPPRERIEHVVEPGDTWWSVALRHGVDGRDLRAYNYPYSNKLQPGATLHVWIDPVVYASGHEHHMHVRFGCGSFETECVP